MSVRGIFYVTYVSNQSEFYTDVVGYFKMAFSAPSSHSFAAFFLCTAGLLIHPTLYSRISLPGFKDLGEVNPEVSRCGSIANHWVGFRGNFK